MTDGVRVPGARGFPTLVRMDEVPSGTGTAGVDDRDPWGRFRPGNKAATGHGKNRLGMIRRAFLDCVTPLEVRAFYKIVFACVMAGDAQMARIWADYCMGKPKHAEDDEDEAAQPLVIEPPEALPAKETA